MTHMSRRTVLTSALATAAAGTTLVTGVGVTAAHAAGEDDFYNSNTDLYTQLAGQEGTDFGRRYKRHQMLDSDSSGKSPFHRTTIMALHGGGIEIGTSELCLGIAGYDPKDLSVWTPDGGPVHDYWMFEGLLSTGNSKLHVTSKNCDDHVARSMAASSLNVLSLHGCKEEQAGATMSVVVGGLNADFKTHLHDELRAAGFNTIDGSTKPDLAGVNTTNPCNLTMLGKGGQLEITTDLRQSLFGDYSSRPARARTATSDADFVRFAGACRRAIARLEAQADQQIL
ncbi:poly-gamma-glutamate hydrolase family protein [Streptomyces sp. NBC_01604]|uniref:poly-gamma-glutamate hydrolase family protein n=1 Tax=Streptomyces sp. NBC_01604 TaxID=2975894 RepID=UPI00386CC0CD